MSLPKPGATIEHECHVMIGFRERVLNWEASLPTTIDASMLLARCSVAHKWKATFRLVLAREASLWRMTDLGRSFVRLVDGGDALAARIILRSACETAALLAYQNKKTTDLLEEKLDFETFNEISKRLLLGGQNEGDYFQPVNAMTTVGHFAKNHPLIQDIYNRLSEDSHPNAAGTIFAFSESNPAEFETTFKNKIRASDATREHTESAADLIFLAYEQHYNDIWPQQFEALEQWLRDNDDRLQSYK